jgi:hypothetical protein
MYIGGTDGRVADAMSKLRCSQRHRFVSSGAQTQGPAFDRLPGPDLYHWPYVRDRQTIQAFAGSMSVRLRIERFDLDLRRDARATPRPENLESRFLSAVLVRAAGWPLLCPSGSRR